MLDPSAWHLLFLGSGSAFTEGGDNWQSNLVLRAPSGARLLIDCGGDARFSLAEQGLEAGAIDAVYVSHLHSDHIGGLEWLAFSTRFALPHRRPRLFVGDDMADALWEHALKAGLGCLGSGPARLESYFDVVPIPAGGGFAWEGAMFETVPVLHVGGETCRSPAYGLSFDLNGRQVLLTTDTRFTPEILMHRYRRADIILHDCETAPMGSGVHARYADLLGLPAEIRGKMWLYHYQPGTLPDARADGFRGFVAKGRQFV